MADQVHIEVQNDSQVDIEVFGKDNKINRRFSFAQMSVSTGDQTIEFGPGGYDFSNITTDNVSIYTIYKNGVQQSGSITLQNGDTIKIEITKNDINKTATVSLLQ